MKEPMPSPPRSSGPNLSGKIVLHDAATGSWLAFEEPHQIFTTDRIADVVPAIERVEALVQERGWHAAGFLSYEAAGAFDPALRSHPPGGFPLLCFGLYSPPRRIELPEPDYGAYSLGEPSPSVSRQAYRDTIQRIRDHIAAGDTYQVNYTLRLRIPFKGDPWHLFLAMVRAQSPGYAAWVEAGRFAVCSASPELFFRLDGERLTARPMKGTVRRGRTQDEDQSLARWLQQSEKNRAENVMIVDMIRNDLGRVARTGSVRVASMFDVERHPTLWQMTSTVCAETSQTVCGILEALFPCASITGAPKIRTTEIIAGLETTPRGLYTGCIGFIAPGRQVQFNVAIRTAVVDLEAGMAEYGAGGGIVWDSEAGDEYAEALLKARILAERRPEFSLLETILWTPEEGYFLLDFHLQRLADSAAYFGYPAETDRLAAALAGQQSQFPAAAQRVRLLLSREGNVQIEALPLEDHGAPRTVRLAAQPVESTDIFLYHKTTNRTVYEKAREAAAGCDDVLLWNERRELTESCVANLVLEIDGELLTPPVASGLLPGTFRRLLLEQGKIRERILKVEDLTRCSKIYLISSVRKWKRVRLKSRS